MTIAAAQLQLPFLILNPDRILPTYGVCARQRPSGASLSVARARAWDAVPLTVRGLNKAAGNPPLMARLCCAR